jgi:hypothetical protein
MPGLADFEIRVDFWEQAQLKGIQTFGVDITRNGIKFLGGCCGQLRFLKEKPVVEGRESSRLRCPIEPAQSWNI